MLVRPFIQPIPAFNVATENGIATVCVLGGDVIEKINYEIYSGSSLLYSSSVLVSDAGGDAVRSFNISLTSSMGLQNNNSYTIRVYTQNVTLNETSGYSSVQYFACYATPTITIKDSSNVTVTSGYEFTSQSGNLSVVFDKGSIESPAVLNDIEVEIYGITSSGKDLVYSSGNTYSPFVVHFDSLTPTTGTNPLYSSYSLYWVAHTVQNMELSGSMTGMSCDYAINETGDLIQAQNDANVGGIRVSFRGRGGKKTSPFSPNNYIINAMATDGQKVYCGGTQGKFSVFDVAEDSFGTLYTTQWNAPINDCVCDEDKVYVCCGQSGVATNSLYVYTKATETFGRAITIFDSSLHFVPCALAIDNTNIYVGAYLDNSYAQQSSSFAKFQKSNMTKTIIENPFTGRNMLCMTSDDSNVYCAGSGGSFAVYNKSTGLFGSLITSPSQLAILSIDCDDNYVYCGGTSGYFALYNKSTGTFGSLIPNQFGLRSITSVSVDSTSVYVGGGNGYFAIYDKATNSFGDIIDNPFRENNKGIYSIKNDENNVYLGGQSGLFYVYEKGHDIVIRRKNLTENGGFVTLVSFSSQMGNKEYSFVDYYTKTNTVYEYEIIQRNLLETVQVLSQFCGAYIADGTKAYGIEDEWEKSSAQRVQKSVLYEPYGRKYPVVAYNAITNYRSGTDTAILRAKSNVGNITNDYIDRFAQTKLTKEFNDFLTNRKVKVIKDFNGDIAIVNIIEAIPNNYVKELGNTLATTQFSWVEVGDFTDSDFKQLGITNSFYIVEQSSQQ